LFECYIFGQQIRASVDFASINGVDRNETDISYNSLMKIMGIDDDGNILVFSELWETEKSISRSAANNTRVTSLIRTQYIPPVSVILVCISA
jgi:hypothetical protein